MVLIKDKEFVPYISASTLKKRIEELGADISKDFSDGPAVLIGVLNGAFMFLSDLTKTIKVPIEVTFIRVASYIGSESSGEIKHLMGLDLDLEGKSVILVEDIIDTGLSMKFLLELIRDKKPKKIAVASLLLKPDALVHDIKVDYLGFEISNRFVVGYGMDYDGLGRNLPALYQLK
ncbi:hypoxanthine phosphoribosyltransferase [Aquiflexum lacus]|uniref:hypoxanthine phosphoribosyltransferase n=1 Tax=Aquiflexum lacus TaxID=2483805 RepID=UPI0018953495|nr:hypoxanthine phosphoribosyltransferase [Aquiflexum lacus]